MMETVARKIGNSVGVIFPKGISPEVGEAYRLKSKKEEMFKHAAD